MENYKLIFAAAEGNLETLSSLLEKGADPDIFDDTEGHTGLICASQNGHLDCVSLLLEFKASVNLVEKLPLVYGSGDTALICAAREGHTDIVTALIAAGANLDIQGLAGKTALIAAAINNNPACVEVLLINNADYEIKMDNQYKSEDTAFELAIANGSKQCVEVFIKHQMKYDVTVALYTAIKYNSQDILDILLRHDGDPNVIHKDHSLLAHAVFKACTAEDLSESNMACISALLKAGADPNKQTKHSDFTLPLSLHGGIHTEVLQTFRSTLKKFLGNYMTRCMYILSPIYIALLCYACELQARKQFLFPPDNKEIGLPVVLMLLKHGVTILEVPRCPKHGEEMFYILHALLIIFYQNPKMYIGFLNAGAIYRSCIELHVIKMNFSPDIYNCYRLNPRSHMAVLLPVHTALLKQMLPMSAYKEQIQQMLHRCKNKDIKIAMEEAMACVPSLKDVTRCSLWDTMWPRNATFSKPDSPQYVDVKNVVDQLPLPEHLKRYILYEDYQQLYEDLTSESSNL
ncbi:unnamed protein product [Owenia fusiformis]|uniref:Uncharacterized protein n=1 Tax=Owenia fusiformis TaxID=6347 RepID=A0A8S4N1B2_OWEFU|nr:unnamed protein product [Owenia fusiformis]